MNIVRNINKTGISVNCPSVTLVIAQLNLLLSYMTSNEPRLDNQCYIKKFNLSEKTEIHFYSFSCLLCFMSVGTQ